MTEAQLLAAFQAAFAVWKEPDLTGLIESARGLFGAIQADCAARQQRADEEGAGSTMAALWLADREDDPDDWDW